MSDDTNDLIRRGDAAQAFAAAATVPCATCGAPRNNHPYRHPFIPTFDVDPLAKIAALPAADVSALRAEAREQGARMALEAMRHALPDDIQVYRLIKRSGAKRHINIAKVVSDHLDQIGHNAIRALAADPDFLAKVRAGG